MQRNINQRTESLPVRGAWIEIMILRTAQSAFWSLPVRGAWIEMDGWEMQTKRWKESLPVRGAWIEILLEQLVFAL